MSNSPLTPMTITVEPRDDVVVVQLAGSADVTGAEKFGPELLELVAVEPRLIVLDMAGVDFAGSAALGAIVKAYIRCRSYGGEMRLANLQRRPQQAMELTRLTKVFDIFESVEAALD